MEEIEKIRIGNDIEIRWKILLGDPETEEVTEYDLTGRTLEASLLNCYGEVPIDFRTEGSELIAVYRGKDQKSLGRYAIILRENNGENGMKTVDTKDAFELVRHTRDERHAADGVVRCFHLSFESIVGSWSGTIDPILNYEAELAEARRKANEEVRVAAEQARQEAEAVRSVSELAREAAEDERQDGERARQEAEDIRRQGEIERSGAELARLEAEELRKSAEAARESGEEARNEAEAARQDAEAIRIANENERKKSESARGNAEAVRKASESSRNTAEAARVSAEEQRRRNEAERQAKFAAALVQETGQSTDKVMSQKAVTDALEGKQEKLVAGDNITIVGNVISSTGGGGGGGSIDLSSYAKKEEVDAALEGKQDTISDLDTIRQGAAKGSTALQSESDPVYLADKPKLALKVEIPDVSGKVDKVTGKGLSSNDYTDADKLKLTGLENYDDTQVRELIAGKANLQHQHTVADITDFPELYYDATAFFTSGAYPSDRYEELLEAVKAKKTVYATLDEGGDISYVFFMSSANIEGSSSRVLLTTIFAGSSDIYINTFVLQQSGMTPLQESITGKANKATTLAGYGIADAYTKSEVDAAIEGKQDKITIFTENAGLSSYSINPNMLTKLGTLASNVTLSLNTASEEAGVVNVYDIIFTTPANAPSITWPEGITWVGGSAPAIAGGKTYEVSIMDGLATYGEF